MVTIDAINTWENTDRNGGDADSDVDDGPVQTCPTVREVLQAAATLNTCTLYVPMQ